MAIGKILSKVLTPERLFELYRKAYDEVESGLPLHEGRTISQTSVINPVDDQSLSIILLEGDGIPVVTSKIKRTKKIYHQIFFDSEKWFEVGHYDKSPQAFSKDPLPYTYIPNYFLEIVSNRAYPTEVIGGPLLREDRERRNLTIPTIVPEKYVFDGVLGEYIRWHFQDRNEISFVMTNASDVSKITDVVKEYDYKTQEGASFWKNRFKEKIDNIKSEDHREPWCKSEEERRRGITNHSSLNHLYEELNTYAIRIQKYYLQDTDLKESIKSKTGKLIEEIKRSIEQTKDKSVRDLEGLLKAIEKNVV